MSKYISETSLQLYQDINAVFEVIGCLINHPELLTQPEYSLDVNDFIDPIHKLIYIAIHNLAKSGCQKLDAYIIENYFSMNGGYRKKLFDRNSGVKYLEEASEYATIENFKANYTEVRKWSALRNLARQGIDVSDYFDPDETDPEEITRKNIAFSQASLKQVLEHFEEKFSSVSGIYSEARKNEILKAGGAHTYEQKEKWKQSIDFGLSYASNYLTTVTYGLRRKRFTVMSAGSGTGKQYFKI